MGITKRLLGFHGIGFALFVLFAVFSYISLSSYQAINNKSIELAHKIELVGDLQSLIHKTLMPPNDYLITGDIEERRNFAKLITETAALLEKMKAVANKADDEKTQAQEIEKGFIELQQKALVLLSTNNPTSNRKSSALMKEMDAFGSDLAIKIEKLHNLIWSEMDKHNKKTDAISRRLFGIFMAIVVIVLFGSFFVGFMFKRKIALPLLELTSSANLISQGNLEHRVNVQNDDEIGLLGTQFNTMAQSLKEKIDEVKEYSASLEKANRRLDQNILQLYALYNISKNLSATFEMEKLLNQVVESVSQALKLHRLSVMLVDAQSKELKIVAGADKAQEARFRLGEGVYGIIAVIGIAEMLNDLSAHPSFIPTEGLDDDISSLICAPFKGRGQVIGLLNAYRVGGETFDEASYELLIATASQVGIALENAMLFEETKILAITDGLTSLFNRRYFTERLNEEFERACRYKRELSLVMMDIDYFKKYNDTNGHPEGDKLLKDFSMIAKKIFRSSDIVSRYGGEEFVVILPETGKEMAFTIAERLRKEIESTEFAGGKTQPDGRVTISLGVTSVYEGLKSADDLVKNADNLLYRAKEKGRNRTCA
ncbi:MAG: diguanylate cyclase [Nitrospirae bacterium]|nr:diguanylate cyclase [Nitrospirota bacterium]